MNAPQPVTVGSIIGTTFKVALTIVTLPIAVGIIAATTGFQVEPTPKTFREKVRDKFNSTKDRMGNAFHRTAENVKGKFEEGKRKREESRGHGERITEQVHTEQRQTSGNWRETMLAPLDGLAGRINNAVVQHNHAPVDVGGERQNATDFVNRLMAPLERGLDRFNASIVSGSQQNLQAESKELAERSTHTQEH